MAETTKRSNTTTTTIRLTSEEAETVRSAAAARGIGPSTFARAATLRAAGRAAPPARRNRTDMAIALRSEEHTSELQSLMRISYAVFCLKKNTQTNIPRQTP